MMTFCDLHMHSTASDGTDAPRDLPRLVKQAGLSAFALTDHDTTAGIPDAAAEAQRLGIGFIPGIELSVNPDLFDTGKPTGTLHILGYHIRHDDQQLAAVQRRLHEARAQRNPEVIAKLNELGVDIDYDEVLQRAGGATVGRPHIAQVLVEKGYARSIHEAFARYVGMHGKAYVRKDLLTAAQAIDAIHRAGGLASFAHPVQYVQAQGAEPLSGARQQDLIEHAVKRLVDLGLDAIETRHSDHEPADVQRFERLAERFKLLTTGGSDYHGARTTVALGGVRVPMRVCEALCEVGATNSSG